MSETHIPSAVSLVAGGLAGLTVDVALFPLDTIKTRLQAPQGFFRAGGFKGVYNGLNSVALGSAPGSALFFITYDTTRQALARSFERQNGGPATTMQLTCSHLVAASLGEVAACLVRVPTDNVKVRLQSGAARTMGEAVRSLMGSTADTSATVGKAAARGTGFYAGFGATVLRDVPFSVIQFPLYEWLKRSWQHRRYAALRSAAPAGDKEMQRAAAALTPLHAAMCGSVAGGVSAAVTCPIDVLRTRLMLGKDAAGVPYRGVADCFRRVAAEGGSRALFAGIAPRVTWITIGGSIFFGAVETYRSLLSKAGFV
jgi:solute carrier family 25 S-adenosylmethionine transporter 26